MPLFARIPKSKFKKTASEITYEVINTLRGRVQGINGDYEDDMSAVELKDYMGDIEKAIQSENVNLVEYIHDSDAEIKEKVKSIIIDVDVIANELKGVTKVKCSEELTEEGKKQLLDYLTGQFSDGWGEGFEQNAVVTWREEVEYSYEEEDEEGNIEEVTDREDVKVGLYVSFWNSVNFDIDLTLEGLG